MRRRRGFPVITILLVIGAIELMSWGVVALATRIGALHLYPNDFFARLRDDQVAQGARSNGLGWPSHDNPRSIPMDAGPVCASAFGDSFTFALEVEDDETWLHVLSRHAGCTIRNYGITGYGFDQAFLRYERIAPTDDVVMFGLIVEMPRRSVAASWTFYGGGEPPVYSNIKPYFTVSAEGLRLHPIPAPLTPESIAAHHVDDYYRQHDWTTPAFPNLLQVARATYRTAMRMLEYHRQTDMSWDAAHPSGSGVLMRRLVDRVVRTSGGRNQHVVIVLMPIPDQLLQETPHYDEFAADLRRRGDVCVIDTAPDVRAQARRLGVAALSAPGKHPNVLGNRVVAEAVAAGLARCGIKLG
jgi:hypothetical protein